MKKFACHFFLLVLCFIFAGNFAKADEAHYLKIIDAFEKHGKEKLVISKLADCISNESSVMCMEKAVSFISSKIKQLPYLSKTYISEFKPQELGWKDYLKATGKFLYIGPYEALTGNFEALIPFNQFKELYHKKADLEAKNDLSRYLEKSDKVLIETDNIKEYLHILMSSIENCIANAQTPSEDMFTNHTKFEENSKNLMKYRSNYTSYNIVSPSLAAVNQLIYVAKHKKTFGYDKDTMDEAMKIMAFGCPKNLVMESNEDVRMQFMKTLSLIRETVGKAYQDEIKVLQSLSDSLGSEKVGTKAWWSRR